MFTLGLRPTPMVSENIIVLNLSGRVGKSRLHPALAPILQLVGKKPGPKHIILNYGTLNSNDITGESPKSFAAVDSSIKNFNAPYSSY